MNSNTLFLKNKTTPWAEAIYLGDFTRSNNQTKVLKGAKITKSDKTYKINTVRTRQNVVSNKSLKDKGDYYELLEDVIFTSPSLAAAVLLGRECNGNKLWKNENEFSINDLKCVTPHNLPTKKKIPKLEKRITYIPNKPVNKRDNKEILYILSRRHEEELRRDETSIIYSKNKEADALIKDIHNNPEAFFIGCLMNRRIKAEKVWAIPLLLKQNLGTIKFSELKKYTLGDWISFFQENRIHIDNKGMAKVLFLGIKKVNDEYNSDPSNIWENQDNAKILVTRFREFHGIGEKIGTMAVNILLRDFKFQISNLSGIDISPDIQVVKVFKRLGLVDTEKTMDTILAARKLNPGFPGLVDLAAWEIGRDYCHDTPNCNACPLQLYCRYNKGAVGK